MKLTLSHINSLFVNADKYFIARVGNVELSAICENKITPQLTQNAGFYGSDEDYKEWKIRYVRALMESDCVACVYSCSSFTKLEAELYMSLNIWKPNIPYMEDDMNYWLELLDNLPKVGVVSYFAKDMERQVKHLDKIHNRKISTEFEFVASLNTIEGNIPDKDYFSVLEDLKNECLKKKDIKYWFLSCGSYGLLLGNELKNEGKNVYYVGGFLQMIFGLKGKRWDTRNINKLYNKWWKYPSIKPVNGDKVEDWCYGK